MIQIRNLKKGYRTKHGWKQVLNDISIDIPRDTSLGIMGRNGAGKSTLVRLISGMDIPDTGEINTNGTRISWPIGKGYGFQGSLTGIQNIKFLCRIHGVNIRKTIQFVEDFSNLGPYLNMPIKTYSGGMRAKLTFAMSMAVEYECYLIDEGFGPGDQTLLTKAQSMFAARKERAHLIVVSHNGKIIRNFCDKLAILHNGKLEVYEDIGEGIHRYKTLGEEIQKEGEKIAQ